MPFASSSDVKFEIGHVLFIDIVGYSKLLITEQSELLQTTRPRKLIGTPVYSSLRFAIASVAIFAKPFD